LPQFKTPESLVHRGLGPHKPLVGSSNLPPATERDRNRRVPSSLWLIRARPQKALGRGFKSPLGDLPFGIARSLGCPSPPELSLAGGFVRCAPPSRRPRSAVRFLRRRPI